MTPEKNIEALQETMKFTGFEQTFHPAIAYYVGKDVREFELTTEAYPDGDHRVEHRLKFGYGESKDGERHFYNGMQSTLYAISIPPGVVGGIDVQQLEQALRDRVKFDPVAMDGDHTAFLSATATQNETLSAQLQQLALGEPYRFNLMVVKYDPVINFEQDPAWLAEQKEIREKQTVTQFFTHKKKITAAEAPNLLYGRAVNKEYFDKNSSPYLAWIQLDFSNKTEHGNYEYQSFHQNHGFNLDAKLDEFRFVNFDKATAIYNLRKGFIVEADAMVTKLVKGEEQSEPVTEQKRLLIETNPGMRTVNLYDELGNRLPHNVVRKVPVARQRTTVTRSRPVVVPPTRTSSPDAADSNRPGDAGPAKGSDEPAPEKDGLSPQQRFDPHRPRPQQPGPSQRRAPHKGRGLH